MSIIQYNSRNIRCVHIYEQVYVSDLAKPVFSYSDTVVSLTWNDSLRWIQDGYYDDFRVSYAGVINGSRREEYFVTNDTFIALEKMNIDVGFTYTFVVCARKGDECATYSPNLYFQGKIYL